MFGHNKFCSTLLKSNIWEFARGVSNKQAKREFISQDWLGAQEP